jgi:hypothetical protein
MPELNNSATSYRYRVDVVGGTTSGKIWCERRDSNSHILRYWYLKPARLPIPPLSQFLGEQEFIIPEKGIDLSVHQ